MSHVFKGEGKKYFEKSVSLLDNAPKYLVGCVIQKRISNVVVLPFFKKVKFTTTTF